MSKAFEKVLLGLQEFASNKINTLEKLANGHQEWLRGVVAEAEQHLDASTRAPEKRKGRSKHETPLEVCFYYILNLCGCWAGETECARTSLQGKRQKKGANVEEQESKVQEVVEKEEGTKPRRGGRRRKNDERITESEGGARKRTGRSTRSSARKNQTKQAAELKQSVPDLEDIMEEEDQNEKEVVALEEVKVDASTKQKSQAEGKKAKANDSPDEVETMDGEKIHSPSTAPVEYVNDHEEARPATIGSCVEEKGQSPGTVDPCDDVPSEKVKAEIVEDDVGDQGNVESAQGFENGPVHDDEEEEEQSPIPRKSDLVSVSDEQKEDTTDVNVQHSDRPMSEREDEAQEASPSTKHMEQVVVNEMESKASPGRKIHSNDSRTGFAANLISSVKTLLPSTEPALSQEGEKSEHVDKEAILREERTEKERLQKEEAKKQAELEEKARLERIEAEKAREQEELQRQKEEEIAARRRARQEEERRKREEKAKRLEEHKRRRKLEAEAAARSGSGVAGLQGAAATSGGSLAAAKERLAKIQQQAAMLKKNSSKTPSDYSNMAIQNRSTFSGTPQGVANAQKSIGERPTITPKKAPAASPSRAGDNVESHYKSYEISPYRSDHASDDDVPKKPVPEWARGKTLMAQLAAQMYVDPDEVFQQHAKTCSLDQVFANSRKNGKRDFNKRNSSGNWIEDRVTWKEELGYKKAMGYI